MSQVNKNLAKRLRLLAAFYDYPQKEIVSITGIERSSVSAHLHGKFSPKPDQLKQYAKLFNVKVDYLLGMDEPSLEDIYSAASDQPRLVDLCLRIQELWESGEVETIQIIESILNAIGRES